MRTAEVAHWRSFHCLDAGSGHRFGLLFARVVPGHTDHSYTDSWYRVMVSKRTAA